MNCHMEATIDNGNMIGWDMGLELGTWIASALQYAQSWYIKIKSSECHY